MATIFTATLTPKQRLSNDQIRFAVSNKVSSVGEPGLLETSLNFSPGPVDVLTDAASYTYTLTITKV